MWARRCGARPLWPSRVKVFLQSFLVAALGVGVFNYMTSADVGYLDLTKPKYEEVLCIENWPLRHETEDWWEEDVWIDFGAYRLDMQAFVDERKCIPDTPPAGQCSTTGVPLHALQRKLGIPLGTEYRFVNDILEIYALVYLYLTICLWVAVVVHDFTLISRRYQKSALDIQGINRHFPCFQKLFRLTGICLWKGKCAESKGIMKLLIIAMVPFLVVWAVVVFICVIVPCVGVLFLRYPIRLGRVQIFNLCICLLVLCLSLAVRSLVFLGDVGLRPAYAVTWEVGAGTNVRTGNQVSACHCGCVFHFGPGALQRVLLLAVGIGYQSVMLALRNLKGLRRACWANLITVMFAIPLAVYPTEWQRPDGSPIQFRKEGEPVQGEPAFDPFAMMDEQPESAETTCDLRPTPVVENLTKSKSTDGEKMSAPRTSSDVLHEGHARREEVGCCGFPYYTKAACDEGSDAEAGGEPKAHSEARSEEPSPGGRKSDVSVSV